MADTMCERLGRRKNVLTERIAQILWARAAIQQPFAFGVLFYPPSVSLNKDPGSAYTSSTLRLPRHAQDCPTYPTAQSGSL